MAANTMILPSSNVLPRARMDARQIQEIADAGTDQYQMPMYSCTNGIISSVAPSAGKTRSMVCNPRRQITKVAKPASSAVSVVRRRARAISPLPTARETVDAAPASKPMMTLVSNHSTGKQKLIAASCASPRRDTKNRSTASKEMIAIRPSAIGAAWRRRCAGTGPLVRSKDKAAPRGWPAETAGGRLLSIITGANPMAAAD